MEPGKVRPLDSFSREDVRHTLRTHFRAQAAHAGHAHSTASGGGSGRKRVLFFVHVLKDSTTTDPKRLFGHGHGHGAGASATAAKGYILCVTAQDTTRDQHKKQQLELHYLQMLSNLSVDARHTWDLSHLEAIELTGRGSGQSDKTRGSFALGFTDALPTRQWILDVRESATALHEFLWGLCALVVQQKNELPRLVRLDAHELQDTAVKLDLPKKYELDVDLRQHTADAKASNAAADAKKDVNGGDGSASSKSKGSHGGRAGSDIGGFRLTAEENDDALQLLAGVDWGEQQLSTVEDGLLKKLRALEDDNIAFLLSLDGAVAVAPITPAASSTSRGEAPKRSSHASPESAQASVDHILDAIGALQRRVAAIQDWTDDSDEVLGLTSSSMQHFEALNNQMELHFKNSVAVQEELERLMALVEISRDHMRILLKPVEIFPEEAGLLTSAGSAPDSTPIAADTTERTQEVMSAVDSLGKAIRATQAFPANEMAAFRARGDELTKLATAFGERLTGSFDAFLQRKLKPVMSPRSLIRVTAGGGQLHLPKTPTSFVREKRETSSSWASPRRSSVESRFSRAMMSSETSEAEDMNWEFSNDELHGVLTQYQTLFEHVNSMDPRILETLRKTYSKQLAAVYSAHLHSLFRCLRDKIPKTTKHSFTKPTSLSSWSHHSSASSSNLGEAIGASALLQQALDHFVPLVLREQRFMARVFFSGSQDQEKHTGGCSHEAEEIVLVMESVFEKLPKRLNEFGEAVAVKSILDVLSLVVLVSTQLDGYRRQSEFLLNVMVSFQLQMKRMLIKFAEDQETWITSHHVDTRMAGVLGPVQKIMGLVVRIEESMSGKSDDSTLASMYSLLLPATLQWVAKVSESKPKYTALTRFENYLFIYESLKVANPSKEHPLAQYAKEAHERYVDNLQRYLTSIWTYEFKQLVPLFASIESLLTTLPAEEIQYHSSRQEVRRVLDATAATFEKSIRNLRDRMKKHMSANPKALPGVWTHLMAYGSARLTSYAKVAEDCYHLQLDPSPKRGSELMAKYAFT